MPLEETNVIDEVLKPDENGKIPLVITDAGVTTDPQQRMALLMEKIKSYFGAIVNGDLAQHFPGKGPSDFCIRVVCVNPPTEEMKQIQKVGSADDAKNIIDVAFEIWPPPQNQESGSEAAPLSGSEEPKELHSVKEAFEMVFNPFLNDKELMQVIESQLKIGLAMAAEISFVIALPYKNSGQRGELLGFDESEPKQAEVEEAKVAEAWQAAGNMDPAFDIWTVTYTTMYEETEGKPLPTVVVEACRREAKTGIAFGHAYRPKKTLRGFKPVGEPFLIGCAGKR